jgi:hypothetical protein
MSLTQKFIIKKVLLMCCNRSNNNGNVQGNSGRRSCWNPCPGNVRGITEIALRGPGCINGTGRCLRRNEVVQGESGFDDDCFWVSPDRGNNSNWRHCGNNCNWCLRCLERLLSDNAGCPR